MEFNELIQYFNKIASSIGDASVTTSRALDGVIFNISELEETLSVTNVLFAVLIVVLIANFVLNIILNKRKNN